MDEHHEQMARIEHRFARIEDRISRELQKTTRWLIGLALAYGGTILGILGRIAGLY